MFVHIPGCSRRKIGNRGIPAFVLPWYLKVTIEPIFGGFLLWASSKPEPILNFLPSLLLTLMAPIIFEQRPVPFSCPITYASSSSNFFTLTSLSVRFVIYLHFGSFSIRPSPLSNSMRSISASSYSYEWQTSCLCNFTCFWPFLDLLSCRTWRIVLSLSENVPFTRGAS